MKGKAARLGLAALFLAVACTIVISAEGDKSGPMKYHSKYAVHDMTEPRPEIVKPGDACGQPPADAIVIFNGKNTDGLSDEAGNPTKWIINAEGALECTPKAGTVRSKKEFGSIQLHIEWATPKNVSGSSQGRGNSGVFLQGTYEVQVLDCFNNDTYPDGQAGAIYGQKKPLVNVCRAPGEWQSYDIIYHRPIFKDKTNEVIRPGTVTVLQNGVLVQDNWPIKGITYHARTAEYRYHPDKLPLKLQDHGNAIQYRNIWIREIDDIPATE